MAVTTTNHWAGLAAAMPEVIHQMVRKTAFDLAAQARTSAPVDTGFLANSIYVETSTDTTYGSGGTHGAGDSYLLDPVETPEDDYTAYVGVGANYGEYVEYGTRYMAAQPYFQPAVDSAGASLDEALSKVSDQLAGSIS